MDAFKVLARSTSLQKAAPKARASAEQNIPSAGIPIHPQINSFRGSGTSFDKEHRGTKRKRRKAQTPDEDERTIPSSPPKASYGNLKQHSNRDVTSVTHSYGSIFDRKSEEDCRKILKSHKLKVTALSPISNGRKPGSSGEKSNKSTGSNSAPASKGPVQIVPQPLEAFKDLRKRHGISRRLAENLDGQGYYTPTEVQVASIPLLLGSDDDRGLSQVRSKDRDHKLEVDLLTMAPTGSGKTLAYLIPLIQGLMNMRWALGEEKGGQGKQEGVKAIILAPTHELADQIVNEARKLMAGLALKVAGMQKGSRILQVDGPSLNQESETTSIIKADLLVSTPLMLLHAIEPKSESMSAELPSITNLVLDEADVLLDPLFKEQTIAIWNACTSTSLQVSLWSATIGSSIESLAQDTINKRRAALGLQEDHHHVIRLVAGLKDSALPTVSHRLVYTASEQGKLLAIRQIIHPSTADTSDNALRLRPPFLIFTQTISRAIALHSELRYDIPPEAGGSSRIAVLHADLSDSARSNIMAGFRKGEVWVLITTDLLSRGIDFRGMNGVVNYDIPNTSAAYVHRAGRTGRAGWEGGISITLYTKEDIPYVKNVANVIAVSQKAHGKAPGTGDTSIPKWLLDALPTLSKKTKQELRKKGVEARRDFHRGKEKSKEARRTRISTKSGFDRKLGNRRKGSIRRSSSMLDKERNMQDTDDEGDEWNGIED